MNWLNAKEDFRTPKPELWGISQAGKIKFNHCLLPGDNFFFFNLLYHVAFGILVPQPRITSMPPAMEAQSPNCCRNGDPFQGLKGGLLSNTQKWIAYGDTGADKSRDFIGKGHPGGEQEGKGIQENGFASWLTVSGFMLMQLVFRLSFTSHSDSESFLVAHTLLSQDGCQREGFWEVVGHVVSPFDLSWTLRVSDGLLVQCSLPGPPIVK